MPTAAVTVGGSIRNDAPEAKQLCQREGEPRQCGKSATEALKGWAVAYVRYSDDYIRAEHFAKTGRRRIWAGEFETPWAWRKARR